MKTRWTALAQTLALTLALTCAFVFGLAGLAPLGIAPATAEAQEAGDGFSASFDSPDLSGWEHSPDVTVRDGLLRVSAGNFVIRWGNWSEFTLALRTRYSGSGSIGVLYSLTDSGQYELWVGEGEVVLQKAVPGQEPEILRRASYTAARAGEWLAVEVRLATGRHEALIGGESALTAEDSSPLPPGGFGFHVRGEATGEFDDIRLTVTDESGAVGGGSGGASGGGTAPQDPASSGSTGSANGGWTGFLSSLLLDQRSPVDLEVALVNLALAALYAFILSRVYVMWGASLSNRRRFAANFMLVTITTTFVILVVRSSVALSLGLVGALSIIRFRTAVKDPEELAYLFFAIGLGIGLGDNQRMITTVALAIGILLAALMRFLRRPGSDTNLHLTVGAQAADGLDPDAIARALAPYCSKLRLLRLDENEGGLEVSFAVEFRKTADIGQARAALKQLSPGLNISFMDNVGVW